MGDTIQPVEVGVAALIGRYADAVRIPADLEIIHTSGTPGLRPDGTLPDGIVGQTEQAWRNIETILRAAGAELSDVVSIHQWLKNAEDIPAYVEVRKQFVKNLPTNMLAAVPALVRPEFLVEIEVTAAVPAREER